MLIAAPDLDRAVAGAPVVVVESDEELDRVRSAVAEEIASIKVSRETAGLVVKADTLGSLEALVGYVESMGFPVRYADVGPVVKRDIIEASITSRENRYLAAVIAFNVRVTEEARELAKENGIEIFEGNIIYRVVEDFANWYKKAKEEEKKKLMEKLVLPGAIRILPGYVFRRSNPAIVGVKVLAGRIRGGYPLILPSGRKVGEIMQIQVHGEPVPEAVKGDEVAISIRGHVIVGRQIDEGDILYVDVPLDHIDILLEKFGGDLSEEERDLLRELRKIKLKKKG